MRIVRTDAVEPVFFHSGAAQGVTGRIVIGQADGAPHFCMRRFDLAPQGHTPRHAHAWEHEIFFHAGSGEVLHRGEWRPVRAGDAVFIPGGEEHQIRNSGENALVFLCLIPAGAPEL